MEPEPELEPEPEAQDEDGDALMTSLDPASSLPTPPPHDTHSTPQPESSTAAAKRAEGLKRREALDTTFLSSFQPHCDWLPQGLEPSDYTPEFCRALEKMYWKSCSTSKPWYGADMKGSLFTPSVTAWNVASLPSALSRLLPPNTQVAGVNTPYLYFGMWRATFAWHVEDMDLFSINYIHFGAPKHWYAIPQSHAPTLESFMSSSFPGSTASCPQFLRHKAYLASPKSLSSPSHSATPLKPNVLVQHAGEFVITFPRGYHAGFNLGLNCAESVNFALESWVDIGRKARVCQCAEAEDSVWIDVGKLVGEREERERVAAMPQPQPQRQSMSPSKKRKTPHPDPSTTPSTSTSKSKRPKFAPPTPDTFMSISHAIPSKPRAPKPKLPRVTLTLHPSSNPSTQHASTTTTTKEREANPCCLCSSSSSHGLLRVHDVPPTSLISIPGSMGVFVTGPGPDGIWRAHEECAVVVPETWVDEVDVPIAGGGYAKERMVWGVDGVVKDRWMLKCSSCPTPALKTHGAPIQCTKGKCSKAFHVSCAISGIGGVSYRVLESVEKEVVLVEPALGEVGIDGGTARSNNVIKTIKKNVVECFCAQHNPALIAAKKANRDTKLRADLDALHEGSRIRIRTSGGVFEVSLVAVNSAKSTVEVIWDGGVKREFKWGSIVWGSAGEGGAVVRKPGLEELAKATSQQPQTMQPQTQAPPPPTTGGTQLQFQAAYTPAQLQAYYASIAAASASSSSQYQAQAQSTTVSNPAQATQTAPTTHPTTQPTATTTPYTAYQHYYSYYSYGQVPYGATPLPSASTATTQPTAQSTSTSTAPTSNPTPAPAPAPAPAPPPTNPTPIPTLALSPAGYQPSVSMAGTNVAKYEGMGSFRVELGGGRMASSNAAGSNTGAGLDAGTGVAGMATTAGIAIGSTNENGKTAKGRIIRPAPSASASTSATTSTSSTPAASASAPTKSSTAKAKAKSSGAKAGSKASIAPALAPSSSQPTPTPTHPTHGHPYMPLPYYGGYYPYAAYGAPTTTNQAQQAAAAQGQGQAQGQALNAAAQAQQQQQQAQQQRQAYAAHYAAYAASSHPPNASNAAASNGNGASTPTATTAAAAQYAYPQAPASTTPGQGAHYPYGGYYAQAPQAHPSHTQAHVQSQPQSQPHTQPQPQPQTQFQSQPHPSPQSQPPPQPQSQPQSHPQTPSQPLQPQAQFQSQPQTHFQGQTQGVQPFLALSPRTVAQMDGPAGEGGQ
ncbi:hypothetical protein M422DRAFT_31236 [Sphaerobolus stellatus SS14]|uniref:[Histone H3]-trimethyl-L-lysine(9) demethylase n=1 Tax=Sphaerobolus stellatus (strain SS14) TaxID=990650 RepID=A0A0C9VLM1_SPHS4|nr:hypothetical protein M422DRAFT_31236 [Sphaerobolus stellatus SS14]